MVHKEFFDSKEVQTAFDILNSFIANKCTSLILQNKGCAFVGNKTIKDYENARSNISKTFDILQKLSAKPTSELMQLNMHLLR
jgi:hypothetical protein